MIMPLPRGPVVGQIGCGAVVATNAAGSGDTRAEIEAVRSLMLQVCGRTALPPSSHQVVVEHFLDGQLLGKTTHGVGKFCFESQFFSQREGDPWVEQDWKALAVVNGNREAGPVSAAFAVDVAVRHAGEYGIGVVGLRNTQRYGILSTWSEAIAGNGMAGLVMNTSTADSTVAGSRSPVLGVNPLSLAVPTLTSPLVIDLAMTVAPMGALWDARRGDCALPTGAFLDADGRPAEDPGRAVAALIFGGYKGLALSMVVQLLTGSHLGFPMGPDIRSMWETGYTFVAISPRMAGGADRFKAANSRLAAEVRRACAEAGLRVPGEEARARRARALASGLVELALPVYERLTGLASGARGPEGYGIRPA
jgi:L-2-hydroxycarboxylate dehydrogenase (NAD+)